MEWWGLAILGLLAGWPLWATIRWALLIRIPRPACSARVTLILPYAPPGELEPLWHAIAAQSLPPARLIIAVARAGHAPALPALACPTEIVVAGPATQRGQKCHNLIAALDRLDGSEELIAFIDADIVPPPWWLAAMAEPLLRGSFDITGGYRWQVPEPGDPFAQAVAWLDRACALLPKPGFMRITWGGSVMMRPEALPVLRQALDRALSDDLMLGWMARRAGLRLLLRGALLAPSPLGAGALSFWARQLRIIRLHNPALWWLQLVTTISGLILWLIALSTATLWLLALLIGAGLARFWAQDVAASRLATPDLPGTRWGQLVLAVTPLADLVCAACLAHSALGRRVTWRGITYLVRPDKTVSIVSMS